MPSSTARSGVRNGSIRDHLHLEAQRTIGNDRTDVARADQAQSLGGEFDAHEAVLLPLARLGRGIGLRQLAGEREHQRDGVLGGGDRVAERGVHDDDTLGRSSRNIDIVDADPGTADDLEVGRRVEDRLGHLGRGTDGKAIILADDPGELFGRLAGDDIDFAAALAEDLRGFGVHFVGNKNFRHVGIPLSERCDGPLRRQGSISQRLHLVHAQEMGPRLRGEPDTIRKL